MTRLRLAALTMLALLAFAGNSLLCRQALQHTSIDPASFTMARVLAGALTLWLLVRWRRSSTPGHGSWPSALALFGYAAAFSYAYVQLAAGIGALLLFGAVQATMVGHGLYVGERMRPLQWLGFGSALAGMLALLAPGATAPPLAGAALMLCAGVAWGVYSLRGRRGGDPLRVTAANFLRATVLAAVLSVIMLRHAVADSTGLAWALVSGALTSGVGYAIWYSVLPTLSATQAAIVQLSVPVLTALGAVLWLGEAITLRLLLASIAILGGIACVVVPKHAR